MMLFVYFIGTEISLRIFAQRKLGVERRKSSGTRNFTSGKTPFVQINNATGAERTSYLSTCEIKIDLLGTETHTAGTIARTYGKKYPRISCHNYERNDPLKNIT